MTFKVEAPGLATTVQDNGRFGYYHLGIPPSGSLDLFSALAANLLVGNDDHAAVLEFALLGPELVFDSPTLIAVTGADMKPRVNGHERPLWESFRVVEGDRLTFDYLRAGARGYLAMTGGIDVPEVLGSRSTYALGALGGFNGRTLGSGDTLDVGPGQGIEGLRIPEGLRPTHGTHQEIRVVLGLYVHRLSKIGLATLLETDWKLSPVADRIGFRYGGAKLEYEPREPPFGAGSDPSNIVDAPYPIGSIQVPGGVEPIVLHRDAVSGGGYMMVGTVISADLDTVAQGQPGSLTRFVDVTLDDALEARRARAARIGRMRDALA